MGLKAFRSCALLWHCVSCRSDSARALPWTLPLRGEQLTVTVHSCQALADLAERVFRAISCPSWDFLLSRPRDLKVSVPAPVLKARWDAHGVAVPRAPQGVLAACEPARGEEELGRTKPGCYNLFSALFLKQHRSLQL